jgi:hypothetical protein
MPSPWKKVTYLAVGGLTEVGFAGSMVPAATSAASGHRRRAPRATAVPGVFTCIIC